MKEDKFIKENYETWKNFEFLLHNINKRGFGKITAVELDSLMPLYMKVSGHLSYSKTNYGNTDTTVFLNKLVSNAHNSIYKTQTSKFKSVLNFMFYDFPMLIRENAFFICLSTGLFLLGCMLSFVLTMYSQENAAAFVGKTAVESMDNISGSRIWNSPVMSSFILTNNIKVGFMAFALGVSLGIGTVWVLIQNGFLLGSLGAIAIQKNVNLIFWSMILPHGVIELFAIFICGAAGLILGNSLIKPGINSYKDSFINGGKKSIKLVLGTIPLFIVAGLIEGFITPSTLPAIAKLSFALITLVLLCVYIFLPLKIVHS